MVTMAADIRVMWPPHLKNSFPHCVKGFYWFSNAEICPLVEPGCLDTPHYKLSHAMMSIVLAETCPLSHCHLLAAHTRAATRVSMIEKTQPRYSWQKSVIKLDSWLGVCQLCTGCDWKHESGSSSGLGLWTRAAKLLWLLQPNALTSPLLTSNGENSILLQKPPWAYTSNSLGKTSLQ